MTAHDWVNLTDGFFGDFYARLSRKRARKTLPCPEDMNSE